MKQTLRRTIFDACIFTYLVCFAILAILRPDADRLIENMNFCMTLTVAGSVVGFLLSLRLRKNAILTLGDIIYTPRYLHPKNATPIPLYRTFWGVQLLLTLLATFVLGWVITDINPLRLLEAEAISSALRLFSELASPDWSILPKATIKIIESIFIAFMATALSTPIAFILSFLSARNIMGKSWLGIFICAVLRIGFNLSRSIEPILWAIIFSVWVSFGPFAGMLALMIHSVASLAKQYSEIVEGVSDGPIEGIEATGAGAVQVVWFAVVPQVVLPYISYTIYRWDTNLRMATILGFVGGGGIGTLLMEYQGQSRWPQVGTIVVVMAFVVWLMDAFSSHVRSAVK
jgi:phosphonate transport system permease protein